MTLKEELELISEAVENQVPKDKIHIFMHNVIINIRDYHLELNDAIIKTLQDMNII